jgi:hypothetical protein
MNHRDFRKLANQFKSAAISTLKAKRRQLVSDPNLSASDRQEALNALDNAEQNWQEHWEPGGEFYVPQYIMEGGSTIRPDGVEEPLVVSPMDAIYVHPRVVGIVLDMALQFQKSENMVEAVRGEIAVKMCEQLLQSRGQFVVWSMSCDVDSISENCWIVFFGDVCGMGSADVEDPELFVQQFKNNGIRALNRDAVFVAGLLHWDFLIPFIGSGLVEPLAEIR